MSRAQRGPLAAFAVLSLASATAVGSLMASADTPSETAQHGEILIQARAQEGTAPVAAGERDLLGGVLPGETTNSGAQTEARGSGPSADRSPRNRTAPRHPDAADAGASAATNSSTRDAGSGSDFRGSSTSEQDGDRAQAETKPPIPNGPSQPEKDDPRSAGIGGGGKQKHPSRVDDGPDVPAPEEIPGPGKVSPDEGPHRGHLTPRHEKRSGKHSTARNGWKPKRPKHGPKHVGKPGHAESDGKGKNSKGKNKSAQGKSSKKRGGSHRGRR